MRYKDYEWRIAEMAERPENARSAEPILVALLMDIRDELKLVNRQLTEMHGMPKTMADILRAVRGVMRHVTDALDAIKEKDLERAELDREQP